VKKNSDFGAPAGADRSAFVARLQLILSHWPSADRLARSMGVSPSAFRKWLKGEAEPSRERLIALAEAAQVGVAWLARGEGPDPTFASSPNGAGRSRFNAADVEPSRFLVLPREPGAGTGNADTPPLLEYIAFRHDWIRASLRADPDSLALEAASGEEMSPTIRNGDLLLVDTSDRRLRGCGIYMINVGGERMVRRVQRKHDGSVVLISDNGAYQADLVRPEQAGDIAVIGRVVWSGGAI
jgi:transcriptional regulator with XRE-family HTH domain